MDISGPPHCAIWHWRSEPAFLAQASSLGGRGAFQRIRGCIQTCGAAGEAPLTIMRDASIKWAFPVKLTRELVHAGGDLVIKFYGGGIALR